MRNKNMLSTLSLEELLQLWDVEMGFVSGKCPRKTSDEAEECFWEELAPQYHRINNLYEKVEGLRSHLHCTLDGAHSLLEVGTGTCNFTLPLSNRIRSITGVEPSRAMRREGENILKKHGRKNVTIIPSKVEDVNFSDPFDYVLSINSLYRVRDIASVLEKMTSWARKECIIIRSLTMMPYYSVLIEKGLPYKGNRDDLIIVEVLQRLGENPVRTIVEEPLSVTRSIADIRKNIKNSIDGIVEKVLNGVLSEIVKRGHRNDDGTISFHYIAKYAIIRW